MQLLKVEETFTEELGFNYVLIVDTEGLRAPELNNKSQKWDNELATFVIGLGNLTLINIFGENPSEIQDILQISVQAFLRMKQVNISPVASLSIKMWEKSQQKTKLWKDGGDWSRNWMKCLHWLLSWKSAQT